MQVRGDLSDQALRRLRKSTKEECVQKLASLMRGIDLSGVGVLKTHLKRSDDPASAIIKLASREKIDLLVMGTVCRTGLSGFFIGNTAEEVLSAVNSSVLTVKPEGFVSPVTLE
jgi:nucleotide-binding universal stress UspA family protein